MNVNVSGEYWTNISEDSSIVLAMLNYFSLSVHMLNMHLFLKRTLLSLTTQLEWMNENIQSAIWYIKH